MTVDAIIFDFDGIIIDTETPDFEQWQDFYREHGLDLSSKMWLRRTGYNEDDSFDPARHFEQVTGTPLDEAARRRQRDAYIDRCAQQPLLPGVRRLIEQAQAHGLKLGIASSSYREWVGRWLQQHELTTYFTCIRTRESVNAGKPAPDLYLSVLDCLGLPAERCVAIEDSPTGIQAALAAGLRCIAVPNTMTAQFELPQVALTVSSLTDLDLPALLSQF